MLKDNVTPHAQNLVHTHLVVLNRHMLIIVM